MKIIAIHQPNFIPWFPFFEKMNLADEFVTLTGCQFEKNGYQNRCKVRGKWITNPVKSGTVSLDTKQYSNGASVSETNMGWIRNIKSLLDIDTRIKYDCNMRARSASSNLAMQVARNNGTHYLTNPEAFEKYLDPEPFKSYGIKIIPFEATYKKSFFEMLEENGIEGCRKILKKQKERFNASQIKETVDA